MSHPIVVSKLGKKFRRFDPNRPTTLIETITHGWRKLRPASRFWALQDVNFTVGRGKMLGVIGHNGAGKSTLLRLLGGVGRPSTGSVTVNGRIGALLDLGTGFHPELSGRENVLVAGVIGGLTRKQVEERFDDIVAFAELEQFIDSPLRTYSSGMQMRLAFAIAVHIDPDILLIDEVLAVGDMAFQQKCLNRIDQFRQQGCTIVLVTHEASLVRDLCDEALWLRHGQIAAHGPAEFVVAEYVAEMSAETQRRTPEKTPVLKTAGGRELRINENRFGSLEMTITGVTLHDENGRSLTEVESGDPVSVHIHFDAPTPMPHPIFSVSISREEGTICYDTSTDAAGVTLPTVHGQGVIRLHLDRLDLIGGSYFIDVGVYEPAWEYAYDYHWQVYPLTIADTGGDEGFVRPPHHWEIGSGFIQQETAAAEAAPTAIGNP